MISDEIVANPTCGICLERISHVRCCRCSFALCRPCFTKFRTTVKRSPKHQLRDQCGQCKKQPPWMMLIDQSPLDDVEIDVESLEDADDADDADDDVEYQAVESLPIPEVDFEHEGCVSPTLKSKLVKIGSIMIQLFCLFAATEILGILYFATTGDLEQLTQTSSPYHIFIFIIMCAFVGMLVLCIMVPVLLVCVCVGGILIMDDNRT